MTNQQISNYLQLTGNYSETEANAAAPLVQTAFYKTDRNNIEQALINQVFQGMQLAQQQPTEEPTEQTTEDDDNDNEEIEDIHDAYFRHLDEMHPEQTAGTYNDEEADLIGT